MEHDDYKKVSFSSFLAGALLVNKNICILDLIKYMNDFCNKYDVYVSDRKNGNNGLDMLINITDNFIDLKYDYESYILLDGKNVLVSDYLYSLTSFEVREYFNIPEKDDVMIYKPKAKKKQSMFYKFKRTKVYI